MDKWYSLLLHLVPLLSIYVIMDLTSLETCSGHVKRMKTGQAVNQHVNVSHGTTPVLIPSSCLLFYPSIPSL